LEGTVDIASAERRTSKNYVELSSAERLLLGVAIGTEVLAFILSQLFGRVVYWTPFLCSYLAALGFVIVGAYVRTTKGKPRIALILQGIGFYMAFMSASSVLIYTLLPLPNPMVDTFLTQTGHWIGYDWGAFVATMIQYPMVSFLLGVVYHSALFQLLLTIGLLAYYGRSVELYRFILVAMIALTITVAIWWRWPSVGYVGVLPYSVDEMNAAGLYFKPNKGELLTRLIQEGPSAIYPGAITGVVGFPSFHTVMALLVAWYCRRTFLFLPILLVNVAMIPAILLHGGHHAIDVLGGLLIFILSVQLANRLIRPDAKA
jgi:membrane-associated phospholipid phosphatase